MAILHVEWINKPGGSHNPNTRILELGGSGWRKSEDQVIGEIDRGAGSYTVTENGVTVNVVLGVRNGRYYLKTKPDGTPLDNLLSLRNIADK